MRNVVLAVAIVLAGVFALQNMQPVSLTFVVWRLETTVSVAWLAAVMLGIVIGALTMLPSVWRARREVRAAHRQAPAADKPALPASREVSR